MCGDSYYGHVVTGGIVCRMFGKPCLGNCDAQRHSGKTLYVKFYLVCIDTVLGCFQDGQNTIKALK